MKLFYRLTWIALLLSVAMTVLSAWIRLSDSGIGCEPWPDCFSQQFTIDDEPGLSIAAADPHRGLRVLHRAMASTFALLITIMALLAVWYRKRWSINPALPVACFLLTVVLSIVGIRTPDLTRPLVTGINLTGGMLLAALVWLSILRQRQALAHSSMLPMSNLASFAIAGCVLLCIASGSWVSANFAAGNCDGFLSCGSIYDASIPDALNPFRELTTTGHRLVLDGNQSLIGLIHQCLGVLVVVVVLGLAGFTFTRRRPRGLAALSAVLSVLLMIQGILQSHKPTLVAAGMHNLLSLALLMLLVYQLGQSKPENQ